LCNYDGINLIDNTQTTEKLPQQGQVPQEEQQGQVLEDLVAKPVPRVQQMLSLIEQLPPGTWIMSSLKERYLLYWISSEDRYMS